MAMNMYILKINMLCGERERKKEIEKERVIELKLDKHSNTYHFSVHV